ncbi:alpha-2-macroglobulin family protein [Spirosoma spitsbergense]|uniref:alpha-2-macroglobulin family protein n=1 Tax=Spirosoma spitsbergense TaxID=431554 RepID=UPI000362220C|nr:alpha-2-macroglobulin family protein [Spirosoma spitsbergense]
MHAYLTLFFVLLSLASSAQNKPMPDYARDWKRADSLAAKGLPKSALEIANRIYKEAKAQENYPQVAKAVMSRMIFRSYSDEKAYKELVRSIRTDVVDTPEPAKSVLQSVLADVYWQYFQQNRYKFYDRATIGRATVGKTTPNAPSNQLPNPNDSTGDFTTWDAHQLVDAVTSAYLASVQQKTLLQKTPISAYDALLDKGDPDVRPLRPTLYDLLAHRAIDFFQNTEPDLLKPVFRFELDRPDYFSNPETFAKLTIQSLDSLSGRYQALLLYQQVVAFHLNDASPDALADTDVQRLEFVHRHSTLPKRDSLYQKTLNDQITQYKNRPTEAVYTFQLAQFLANTGSPVRPLDDNDDPKDPKTDPSRWNRKQSADLCRDIIKRFPKTLSAKQAAQLLSRLTAPTFTVQVEQVNVPDKPFRALVSYQNVSKLLYRIFRATVAEVQTFQNNNGNEEQRKKLYAVWLKRPFVVETSVSLPDNGDLNQHSVEIPVKGLPIGQYILLATSDDTFSDKTEPVQFASFTVSGLSYLLTSATNGATQPIVVTNRLTGEPIRNAVVAVIRVNSLTPVKTYTTDANGWVKIPTSDMPTQSSFQYLITVGNDMLLSEQQYNYPDYTIHNEEQSQTHVNLFTDRAIYRPGQLIYVKGLLYAGKTNQYAVSPNQDVTLDFLDQNGKSIAKQTLKTNEFGTFDASFTAPVGRITGQMTLQTPFGSTAIQIEEYKRPTFEVKVNPITQSFKLGQAVTVSANVKTFSGAVVDGADVRYRVMRQLRPRWDWWSGGYGGFRGPRNSNQTEITNGVAQTDAQGDISVTFTAEPDPGQARATNPVFDFVVTIDATDRAGETRSATKTLGIGYSALQISLTVPPQVETSEPTTVPVKIANQAGERVVAKGQLTVYRLQPPTRPLRERLWPRPDRYILSKADFEKLFPNDVYADENDLRSWPKGEVVQQQTINSPADSLIKLTPDRYTPGEYVAELTVTDSTGYNVTEQAFFAAVNDKQPTASVRPDNWVQVRKATAEPGEEAVFWVGNGQAGYVLMTVQEAHKIVRQEWLKTDGTPRRIALPVTESQRGGFAVHFAMIQNGRLYQKSQTITVPFTNKQLTIETETFRTKLKPGDQEEWTLRIKGLEKTPAELVATLYDASLDTFVPLNWPTAIYNSYTPAFYNWRSSGFEVQSTYSLFYHYRPEPAVPIRKYDQLAIGRSRQIAYGGSGIRFKGEVAAMSAARAAPMQAADGFASPPAVEKLYEAVAAEPSTLGNATSNGIPTVNPRRNFNETAFFLPNLKTDEQGRIVLKFTMPEALTRWRLLAFAHTKDLKTGTLEREIITQKELMITANAPRFLREGDSIRVQARVNNLSDKTLDVTAALSLVNALTGESVNQRVVKGNLQTTVTVAAGQGHAVGWTLVIPSGLDAVTCRFTVQSGSFTDGEEFTVPILPNRMLVTDTKPFWVNGPATKSFTLKELTGLNPELPTRHERLTVEVTGNPAWYALQSLPYLMEYRYECAEQLFSRLYANSLAAHIVNSKPEFRQVIDTWQKNPPTSPLESNEELKAVTLENSPWLASARSETERQAKLGQLLDANRMASEQRLAFEKLQQLQTPEGGFRWFGGMQPDLSMTLHILSGFGHLTRLGRSAGAVQFPDDLQPKLAEMQTSAIQYVDTEMKRWMDEQQKNSTQKKGKVIGSWYFSATQYLYARSFYQDKPVEKTLLSFVKSQVAADWTKQSLQGQALAAMGLNRFGDTKTATGIINSMRERSKKSDELGMYWPDNVSGLQWYQAPIETQAYLIEAFGEINPVSAEVDDMKRWLLRQKQTQSWSSTKATTEAVYALLLRGSSWLSTGTTTQVSLGGEPIESRVTKADAITGYQKVTYVASEIRPEMGNISITKKDDGPAWGALYWQHFEPLDKVMPGSAGLSVQKMLYVQHDSPSGPVNTPITEKTPLKPGDLIKVRLILKTDRLMEYVHLKDSRASGFEPIAALSGYKYQNGLGYYESPRDASTDFFMNYLPVGTHVFEYDLRVAQTGDFSAGVATVQCFYAPEFSAHSAGERVSVGQK